MNELSDFLRQENSFSAPQVDDPAEPKKALKLGRQYIGENASILKLVRNRWYVEEDANLLDLADDLSLFDGIQAVGVVNKKGKILGLIFRRDLFDLLGRPFGRDVLKKEPVSKIAQSVKEFYYDTHIFTVSEEIGKFRDLDETRHFPVKTSDGDFAGIFSTQDLLIYLSEITQKDIALARTTQARIVKDLTHFESADFEIVCSSSPAKGLGGDFYYLRQYQPDNWFLSICDVSGKGMAASLVTTALWGAIQSFDFKKGLGTLVKQLNAFIIDTFELEKFISGLFLELNTKTGQILLGDLGHGLSYLFREGRLLRLKTAEKTLPLGVSPDMKPEIFRYQLLPGDTLLLVNDGLQKQKNSQGDEYGLFKLKKILDHYKDESLKSIRARILEDLSTFKAGSPLYDDVTFILLRKKAAR